MILKCPCHKLKKCAARIILDAAPDVPSQLLFNELNWLNIYERIEYNKGILMFKILHGLVPSYLRNLVTFQTSNNYQFRSISNGNLCLPRHATYGIIQAHFQYSGATLWNCLPVTVRTSKTIISFRLHLQNFILSKRRSSSK